MHPCSWALVDIGMTAQSGWLRSGDRMAELVEASMVSPKTIIICIHMGDNVINIQYLINIQHSQLLSFNGFKWI